MERASDGESEAELFDVLLVSVMRLRGGRVIVSHLEQGCLSFSRLAEFVQIIRSAGFGFVLLLLSSALGLISLSLLPCLLFLSLG